MKRFASLYRQLDSSPGRPDLARLLEQYFRSASHADSAWALYLLLGGQLGRIVSTTDLKQWVMGELRLPRWLMERCLDEVGDAGEAITLLSELVADQAAGCEPSPEFTLASWIESRILSLRGASSAHQREAVIAAWRALEPAQSTLFHRLVTGRSKPLVSRRIIEGVLSRITGLRRELLSRGLEEFSLSRFPNEAAFRALIEAEAAQEPTLFDVAPSLASSELPLPFPSWESAEFSSLAETETLSAWSLHPLQSGLRAQIVRRPGRKPSLWLQGPNEGASECVSLRFPEIIQAAASLPEGIVLEGELHPASAVRKRLSKTGSKVPAQLLKSSPVSFTALDVLEGGAGAIRFEDMRSNSFASAHLCAPRAASLTAWNELDSMLATLRRQGAHGLLLKHATTHRRLQLEVPPLKAHAVLLYVETGAQGIASCSFAAWDEENLVPITRAPIASLDPAEIDELEQWTHSNLREKFGPVHSVNPTQVFELAFDEVEPSTRHRAGLTLRSPRILRWSRELKPSQAARLADLRSQMIAP